MGKLIVFILGLALIAFVVKAELERGVPAGSVHTAPRQQLDNVREKARDLEKQEQEAVDRAGSPSESRGQ